MSAYPDKYKIAQRGIWRYKDKRFETKLERDTYQRGFEDGLRECRKKHIREDI